MENYFFLPYSLTVICNIKSLHATLNLTPLHNTTLPCPTLHYTTLHYTTLHYLALHYITVQNTALYAHIHTDIYPHTHTYKHTRSHSLTLTHTLTCSSCPACPLLSSHLAYWNYDQRFHMPCGVICFLFHVPTVHNESNLGSNIEFCVSECE